MTTLITAAKETNQHADAVVDAPENFFWEEILEAYPDSKVILSEREEDSWLKSLVNQLQVSGFWLFFPQLQENRSLFFILI